MIKFSFQLDLRKQNEDACLDFKWLFQNSISILSSIRTTKYSSHDEPQNQN